MKISVFTSALLVLVTLISCKSEPSLQKYFVENTNNKDFIALDVSSSILNLDKAKLSAEQNEADMKASADKYVKSAGLEELMRVNDSGKNVRILVKSGASDTQIKELLMFVDGAKNDETVLLSLTGNFDLNEISVLTDKMQLPGGSDLKKASKGKK